MISSFSMVLRFLNASGMFQALGGMRVASEGLLGVMGQSKLDMTKL